MDSRRVRNFVGGLISVVGGSLGLVGCCSSIYQTVAIYKTYHSEIENARPSQADVSLPEQNYCANQTSQPGLTRAEVIEKRHRLQGKSIISSLECAGGAVLLCAGSGIQPKRKSQFWN